MTQLLFIDFFYMTWGKVLTYLLLLVVPFFTLIGIERMNRRRPVGVYLLLALWLFVSTFERNLFDCNWWEWCWVIATLGIGIGSAYIIGPWFYEVEWADEPLNYILTSTLNTLLIMSICILCYDISMLPVYLALALIFHLMSCENHVMAFTPLFSMVSMAFIWIWGDFSHWYMSLVYGVAILFHIFLIMFIAGSWSETRRNEDNIGIAITGGIMSVITFVGTVYYLHTQYPITDLVHTFPYWSVLYVSVFLATIIRYRIPYCIITTIIIAGLIFYLWPYLHKPVFFISASDISFDLSWNWNLFTFSWCSVIMWIGIVILSLCIIIPTVITLTNYPKRFRAVTVLELFAIIPVLLFFVKVDSLIWIDWICLVVTSIITYVLLAFEVNLEDDEREGVYFLTRIGSFLITSYLLFLCYSLHDYMSFDYRYLCIAVCMIGVYNIVNLPYCIAFWLVSVGYFVLSLCGVDFSISNMSYDLSWNWDLFTLTWCSVIMWVGIAIGSLISVILLVGLFVENGLYAFKYICHTFISILFIYEFAFNNVPIDASWGYWTLFAIGIIFILADYCLIYAMTPGNCDNVTIGFHFTISLVLVSCLCYILYTESESVYLLIASVISGIICSSNRNIVHRTVSKTVSKVSSPVRVKVKPAMQYSGTSMTCPACRERYKTTWVTGIQEKNRKRDVARTATNWAVGGVSIGGFTSLGATIGSAVPGPGTVIGAGIGLLVGSIASVAVKNKINEGVDEIYDYTSSEYGDGLKYRFKCPEPGCGHVWYKTIRHGVIV